MCLCIVTTLFSGITVVHAAGMWDGSTDISWYNAGDPQSSYEITTATELAGLAALVNAGNPFDGTVFTLMDDINLNDEEWTPIGKGYIDWSTGELSLGFEGTFDGGGHTISGLKVTVNSSDSDDGDNLGAAALFGYLLGGTVKNITVDGFVQVTTNVYMGNNAGIVGFNTGTVENCINYAEIHGHHTGGGIVGYNNAGTITKCINYGDITSYPLSPGVMTGGIAGCMEEGEISFCYNDGSITALSTNVGQFAGGIVGLPFYMDNGDINVIRYCYNTGAVTTNYGSTEIGGIAASAPSSEIYGCYSTGEIDETAKPEYWLKNCAGALFGAVKDTSDISNCYYLDSAHSQAYGMSSSNIANITSVEAKTSAELNDTEILDLLNSTAQVWGFQSGIDYPVFLFRLPTLAANETSLDFGSVTAGSASAPKILMVSGTNLTGDITYSKSEAGEAAFTITESSWNASLGGTLSVTFNPTAAQSYNATLTISSTDAEDKTVTLTGTGSSGGGSAYSYYTITASADQGGSISPLGNHSVREGLDKAFTISPNEGYSIADVLVDGKSVGAVETYTFRRISKAHAIHAKFEQKKAEIPFTDVAAGAWYYDAVRFVYEKSLMQGTRATTFSPSATTTRGMIVTILHRLEWAPVVGSNPFSDVESGEYYADAVAWAAENGIVNGYGGGKFGPEDAITREQMAVILMNYAKLKGYDTTTMADLDKFSDAGKINAWAQTAMGWANANELINGKGSGILDPYGNATRAEVAAILQRFVENVVK